jgi:RNase P/RNase MRP subunit p29
MAENGNSTAAAQFIEEATGDASLYPDKVKYRTFSLVNPPTSASDRAELRGKKRQRKRKSFASAEDRKRLRRFEVPSTVKYADFETAHALWCGYIREVTKEATTTHVLMTQLLRADLHAAHLRVHQAKCSSYLNIAGYVLQETMNGFRILTEANEVKRKFPDSTIILTLDFFVVVPKKNVNFVLDVPSSKNDGQKEEYLLYGSQWLGRAGERTSRKWRHKPTVDFQ